MRLFSRAKKQSKLETEVLEALQKIYVFPGSKEEFEDFIGYKTEWVDFDTKIVGLLYTALANDWKKTLKEHNPFESYDVDFQKKIVEERVVAIVNPSFAYSHNNDHNLFSAALFYGMPVKKKF